MGESLEEAKARLSRTYLGKEGIHSLGLRRSQGAITVYFAPGGGPKQDAVLEQLKSDAAPFSVLPVPAERAGIT